MPSTSMALQISLASLNACRPLCNLEPRIPKAGCESSKAESAYAHHHERGWHQRTILGNHAQAMGKVIKYREERAKKQEPNPTIHAIVESAIMARDAVQAPWKSLSPRPKKYAPHFDIFQWMAAVCLGTHNRYTEVLRRVQGA